MVEKRYETRMRYIEGQGHIVTQVPITEPLDNGESVVGTASAPPVKVVLVADDVPFELARQVVEKAGFVAVPVTFLNPDQLAELKISAPVHKEKTHELDPVHKLDVATMISRVKAAESFDELNALVADESRKTVLAAAEQRATELKAVNA